jgi:hypothetical protein
MNPGSSTRGEEAVEHLEVHRAFAARPLEDESDAGVLGIRQRLIHPCHFAPSLAKRSG